MSATLMLVREGMGIELRRGTFEILLDGENVGTLKWRDSTEIPVEPGQHTLRIQAGRYSSATRSFDISDGDAVNFRVHGAMLWPQYVASIIKPDLAISLKRL